ncbi:hypothetical protein K443DRAFT_15733 [Laccaria amethystina LaAM-08-1]|uniref:Uncharacterized protein n=1 Tax=Laccaria amethystina LaAM-08-1 TaxID=1095629 RepID=A0A0C9WQA9_9AGAR|nr:hypothetical protein K443DRAFT_15733 [Laccaria amethystina LaAM-08-1]
MSKSSIGLPPPPSTTTPTVTSSPPSFHRHCHIVITINAWLCLATSIAHNQHTSTQQMTWQRLVVHATSPTE